MTLGEEFRKVRIEADISLKEACRMLRRSMMTLQRLERDDKSINERTRYSAGVVLAEMRNIARKKVKEVNM